MNLKKEAIKGAKWTSYSTAVSTTFQFFQLAILARFLPPDDFGVIAIIMVILGFAQIYADAGVSNAIIYHQNTTKEQLSSLYWLNIFSGFFVFLLLFLSEPVIYIIFKQPKVSEVLPLISIIFIIIPMGQQFQVLLQKELEFKSLSIIEMISISLGTSVVIVSSFMNQGIYSVIWGQLITTFTKTILLIFLGWKRWTPTLHFKKYDLQGYLGFGLYQMGEKSINYLNSRFDQIIIGALLGVQALGYYNLAFNLAIQPVSKINPIITRVAFPIFSKIKNDNEKLKNGYLLVLKIIAFINFPLLFGLAVAAPLLVPLLFGDKWSNSVPLVQILSFVALFRAQGNPVGSLLLAKGRADWGFKWNVFLMISLIPSVAIGLKLGGVNGVAWSLLILQIIYSVLNYLLLIKPLINPTVKEYSSTLIPSFILSFIMAAIIIFMPLLINQTTIITIVMEISLGIIIYFLLNLYFNRNIFSILK